MGMSLVDTIVLVLLLGSAIAVLIALHWARIPLPGGPALDLGALSPFERRIVARRTGGTGTHPDGSALLLSDWTEFVRSEEQEQRRLADCYDATVAAENKAQEVLLAELRTRYLRERNADARPGGRVDPLARGAAS